MTKESVTDDTEHEAVVEENVTDSSVANNPGGEERKRHLNGSDLGNIHSGFLKTADLTCSSSHETWQTAEKGQTTSETFDLGCCNTKKVSEEDNLNSSMPSAAYGRRPRKPRTARKERRRKASVEQNTSSSSIRSYFGVVKPGETVSVSGASLRRPSNMEEIVHQTKTSDSKWLEVFKKYKEGKASMSSVGVQDDKDRNVSFL